MKLLDTDETILLVTGSGLSAEERDRPLAYWLKGEIDQHGEAHPHRRCIVVSDIWYLGNGLFQLNPTITIGGPGVNRVAQSLSATLPMVQSENESAFIQAGDVGDAPKVCLWGVDLTGTTRAVELFMLGGQMRNLLRRIWRRRPDGGGVYV